MNITNVLLVVLVVIIIICFVAKYCQTNKLKENLTMTVTQSKSTSSKTLPEASGTMPHLDNSNSSCGQPLYSCPPSYNSSSCHLPVQKTALNSSPGCVDSECHKSMVGLFGNLFKNLPSADKLPHITHTLQITPKKTQSVSTAASIAASQHGSSIAPAQSSPASVPPSAPSSAASAPVTKSSSATTNKNKCISSGWVSSSLENIDKSSSYKPTKCPTNYLFNYSNPNVQYVYDTTNKCPGNVSIYDKNKTFLGCACIPSSDCLNNLSSTPASVPPSASPSASPSAASAASAPPSASPSAPSSASPSASPSVANTPSSSSSSSSSLKPITTAAECTAAGGKYFNYCPETGKYYCCGVDASKGYEVCGGTDGACPSNSDLKYCVCPSNLSSTPASVPPSAPSSAASAPVTKSSSATTNKNKCISSGWVSSSLENIDKSSSYKPTKCPTNYLFNYSNPNVQYVYDTTNKCPGNVSIYDKNKTFLGCACIPSSDCE